MTQKTQRKQQQITHDIKEKRGKNPHNTQKTHLNIGINKKINKKP
jgi:hypothetical protein